jgi:hypothetical protein
MAALGTADSVGEASRTAAQDGQALGDEHDLLTSSNLLPVVALLFAAHLAFVLLTRTRAGHCKTPALSTAPPPPPPAMSQKADELLSAIGPRCVHTTVSFGKGRCPERHSDGNGIRLVGKVVVHEPRKRAHDL